MFPHGTPLRQQICIPRHTEDIHVDNWEPWESLSNRALRKKGVAARVSLTAFAAARQPEVSDGRSSSDRSAADVTISRAQRRSADDLRPPDEGDQ